MPARPSRVLGYARVSSEEQARGSSLGDQQVALRKYASARDLTIAHIYVESESGIHEKFERREQIQALMRTARRGDLVLVDKIDRWSRDPEFTYRSMRELSQVGAAVYFVGEGIDPATSEGDSMLTFRVAFAREEHKRIKLRTVGTRRLLRDRGLYVEGLPPFGYERSLPKGQRGPDKNVLRVREAEAEIVRDVFRMAIGGVTTREIQARLVELAAVPGRLWHRKSIGTMIRNRVYLGEVRRSDGVWVKGRHVPIVLPEIFTRAADALSGRRRGGARPKGDSRTADWLLRQLGVCANCGSRLSSAYGGGKSTIPVVYTGIYYRCRNKRVCRSPYLSVEETDLATWALVPDRLVELREILGRGAPAEKRAKQDPAHRLAQIDRKRERLIELYGDGEISRDELRRSTDRLDAERTRLEAASQAHEDPLQRVEIRRAMLGQVSNLRRAVEAANAQQRRAILTTLARAVRVSVERIAPEWWTPAEMAVEAAEIIRR